MAEETRRPRAAAVPTSQPQDIRRTCLYIDMAYCLAELRQRGHFQFFEARHSNGYFDRVIGLYPLADRVTEMRAPIERHQFSGRQDVIEAKSTALGLPKWLSPLDLFLTQRRLLSHVAEVVKRENVSIIISTDPLYGGLFGLWLKRRTGLPLVIYLVANFDLNFEATGTLAMPKLFPSRWLEKRIIRYVLQRADFVTAGSASIRDYALAQGVPRERTEVFRVVKNMVPEHRIPPAQRGALTADERQRLGLGDAPKLLLTVSRLEPVKMVDEAIRAFSIVHKSHPDALLLLAGQGSQREILEQLARELGVEENVRFLGLLDQGLLSRLAPGCVVLSPLTGMALAETSMAGCPAIAYDCDSSISDLVESGVTGELVEPKNWRAMGIAASELLSDPAKCRRYSEAIRSRAEQITDETALYRHEHAAYDALFANWANDR